MVQDENKVNELLTSNNSGCLSSSEIEKGFKQQLGRSYHACTDIIEDVREHLQEIEHDLARLQKASPSTSRCSLVKDASSNFKKALTIVFEKGQYMKKIRALRELREDLTVLRGQMNVIQAQQSRQEVVRKQSPGSFYAIRNASMALHTALSEACDLCRLRPSHYQHTIMLSLGVKADDRVCLNLAVTNRKSLVDCPDR